MFDRPPPRTMTSGSTHVDDAAPARAPAVRRSASSAAIASRLAGVGAPRRSRRGRFAAAARPRSRAPAPGRTGTSRCSRCGRSSTAGPGRSPSRGAGSGLCPHSPPIALAPVTTRPVDDDAAARAGADDDAEDDRRAPAAAPSMASDSAKQLASFANRSGRSSSRGRSSASGCPFSQVEFAFLTRPVAGEIVPGNADADRAARTELALDVADQPGRSAASVSR